MLLILIRMSEPFDATCFHLLVGFDLNFEFKLYQMESFFCDCFNLMLLLNSLGDELRTMCVLFSIQTELQRLLHCLAISTTTTTHYYQLGAIDCALSSSHI